MRNSLHGSMEVLQHCITNSTVYGRQWIAVNLESEMKSASNLPSENLSWIMNTSLTVTPATNPELWYAWYEIVKEDAPEVLDEFIENTASKMELTVDYFVGEFL